MKINIFKGLLNLFDPILGPILVILTVIGSDIWLAWLICNIDATDSYSWISGIYHGLFIFPNFIRHLFDENILWVAPNHTIAYTIFFWITVIISFMRILYYLFNNNNNNLYI